nr:hypothetical protein BaRGS_032127 [Batillaria attramentaria]
MMSETMKEMKVSMDQLRESDRESPRMCENKVLRILNDKMGLRHVTGESIEIAHRVGKRPESPADRPRPIIVKFLSRKTVGQVFQNKKKLKNTDFMIVEDLTRANYHLLLSCKDHDNCETAWSLRGNIYARLKNDTILQIKTLSDLDNVDIDQQSNLADLATSTPLHGTRGQVPGIRGIGTQRGRRGAYNIRNNRSRNVQQSQVLAQRAFREWTTGDPFEPSRQTGLNPKPGDADDVLDSEMNEVDTRL